MKKLLWTGLVLASACTTGLDDPPTQPSTPRVARTISHLEAREVAHDSLRGMALDVFRALEDLDGSELVDNLGLEVAPGCAVATRPSDPSEPPVPIEPCTPPTAEERADDLAEQVVAELFDAERLADNDPARLSYRIDASVCPTSDSIAPADPTEPEPPPPEPSNCETYLSEHQLMLRVQSFTESSLELTLELDGQDLATGSISASEVGLEVDLATLRALLEGLGEVEGIDALRGRLAWDASVNGEVLASQLRALTEIEVAVRSPDAFRLLVTPSSEPLARVSVDTLAKDVVAAVAIDEISATIPLKALNSSDGGGAAPCAVDPSFPDTCGPTEPPPPPPPEPAGSLDVTIGRTIVDVGVDIEGNSFTFGRSGTLNDLVVAVFEGARVLDVDVGEMTGDAVAEEDGVLFSVMPGLSVAFEAAMSPVAEALETPEWMNSERMSLALSGATRPTVWLANGADRTSSGGNGDVPPPEPVADQVLKVVDGVLELTSTSLGSPVRVEAGQCLFSSSQEGRSPFGGMSSGTCPP
ncbi:MAG: hypothetical protein HYV07_20900 [Deltaproteobacteria bacterium]|nr:hypothetical protein [Deltaproteobacteria bacterium]